MSKCEWKELDIANLPERFAFPGEYEFASGDVKTNIISEYTNEPWTILKREIQSVDKYVYRKTEPEEPTHEEIMKPRFWKGKNENYWRQITGIRFTFSKTKYLINDAWCNSDYFKGRKSSDMPLEESC